MCTLHSAIVHRVLEAWTASHRQREIDLLPSGVIFSPSNSIQIQFKPNQTPSATYLAHTNDELEWLAPVTAAVKLLAVGQGACRCTQTAASLDSTARYDHLGVYAMTLAAEQLCHRAAVLLWQALLHGQNVPALGTFSPFSQSRVAHGDWYYHGAPYPATLAADRMLLQS